MNSKPVTSRRTFLKNAAGAALLSGWSGACGVPSPAAAGRALLSQPAPMLPPVPAILLSVRGQPGDPDEISVGWSFVVNGEPPQVGVSLSKEHVANPLVGRQGQFVLNVPSADIVEQFDRVDMNTTQGGDKFALSGLTRGAAKTIDAPTVEEAPIQLECQVLQQVELPPVRTIYLALVTATSVLEGVCDASERLIVSKTSFFGMTSGSGEFYTMGRKVGHIGQTVGRDDIRY